RCRSLPHCHRHCSRQGSAHLPPARKKSSSPESSSTLLVLRVRMGKGIREGREDLSAVEPLFTILSLLKVLANIARDGRNGKRCTVKSAQSTKPRGVNPSDLRRINEGVVLAAMGPSHQYRVNELMRITNLTRVTVTDVLRQLQDKGWVAPHSTSRGRGRPAQIYGRVVPGGTVAGLGIGAYELAATIADMHGELLARDRRSVSPALPRRQRLDRAIDLLHSTLEEAGSRSEEHTSELQSRFELVCRLRL